MAGKPAELSVRITGDADDAVSAFDRVTGGARDMGDTVDRASKQVDDGASRMDRAADSADNMASRSSQAAGGLGDLGGALGALPGPLGAMGRGMEAAAPAIMGVTGASDLMNLAMTSSIVTTTRARLAAARHAVATRAQAVATRVMTVAQRALNLAMRANPVGLIITGVLLLAGLFIVLYRRSETFRGIIQSAGAVGRAAFDRVKGAVSTVIDWVGRAVGRVQDFIGKLRDGLGGAASAVKGVVVDAFNAMMKPINAIIDAVQDLIGWIKKIDIPDLPDLTPWNRSVAGRGPTVLAGSSGGGDTVEIHLPLLSALDDRAIDQLVRAISDFYRRRGLRIELVPA